MSGDFDHPSSTAIPQVVLPDEQPVLGEERWREIALHLYTQLDDIDTLYDACKGNRAAFYRQVARHHPRRHDVATTDGQRVVFWPATTPEPVAPRP
jgi:hypothetical protein